MKDKNPQPTTNTLQIIALVLSLIGLLCIGIAALKFLSWGIFALVFQRTKIYVGVLCCIVSLVLSYIAEYQEETDNTTMLTVAKSISSNCLFVVLAFVIYVYVFN